MYPLQNLKFYAPTLVCDCDSGHLVLCLSLNAWKVAKMGHLCAAKNCSNFLLWTGMSHGQFLLGHRCVCLHRNCGLQQCFRTEIHCWSTWCMSKQQFWCREVPGSSCGIIHKRVNHAYQRNVMR